MKRIISLLHTIFSNFNAKLLLAFLFCTLLPFFAISSISYYVTYKIAEDKIMLSTLLLDDQISPRINERISQAENVADSIQYDMYSLTKSTKESVVEYLKNIGTIRNNITMYITSFDFFHINIFLPSGQFGTEEQLYFHSLEQLDYISPAVKEATSLSGTDSVWLYIPSIKLPYVLNSGQQQTSSIACIRSLVNQGNGTIEYAYMILLNTDEFSSLMSHTFDSTPIRSYITTENGEIIAQNKSDKDDNGNGYNGSMEEKLSPDIMSLLKENEGSVFCHDKNRYHTVQLKNNWYYISEIPESYIRNNIQILLNTILITLIFSLPITICIIIMFSKNLTRRITTLSHAMENFKLQTNGSFLHPIAIKPPRNLEYPDEIDKLGLIFNQMQITLEKNMSKVLDLSLAEEKLKYQLLQSQINPHFLYNILGSIQSCLSIEKLDTADQMIKNLAHFYRMSLRNSEELIPISKELEISILYLELEKLCHNNRLTWEFIVEDGAENFLICKFTLQPFLENSILHGLSENKSRIHITLHVSYGNDTVLITISDNGIGIPQPQLDKLHETLENEIVDYEKHFGIGNVSQRIKSPSFGNGTVKIKSRQGEGTTVTIEFAQL